MNFFRAKRINYILNIKIKNRYILAPSPQKKRRQLIIGQ